MKEAYHILSVSHISFSLFFILQFWKKKPSITAAAAVVVLKCLLPLTFFGFKVSLAALYTLIKEIQGNNLSFNTAKQKLNAFVRAHPTCCCTRIS